MAGSPDSPDSNDEFDRILEQVIAELPENVADLLDEVPVIVDDEPTEDILRDVDPEIDLGEPSDLCGLHWGVPFSERGIFEGQPGPDRILLFRGPIQRLSGRNRRELKRQIRITLLHEIGHLFGLDEERLTELGYE